MLSSYVPTSPALPPNGRSTAGMPPRSAPMPCRCSSTRSRDSMSGPRAPWRQGCSSTAAGSSATTGAAGTSREPAHAACSTTRKPICARSVAQRTVRDRRRSGPFSGNPAAVCILPAPAPQDERWMQDVAPEMNLAETAFLHPENEGYRLRWFTPAVEVALCGHATLASAHVLWEEGRLPPNRQARFHTKSCLLTADRRGDWIELDFPATPPAPAPAPPGLAAALGEGVTPRWVGRSKFDYLVELDSEHAVRALTPDLAALERVDA